jgi:hypothetical protein
MGFGLGSEVLCVLSGGLDLSGYEESDPVMVAGERICRRWLTVRGSCFWDPNMGLGIDLLMNADLTDGEMRRVEIDAAQEARQEPGVVGARVTCSRSALGLLTISGVITLDSGQSFTATASADGATEVLSQ